MRIRLEWMSVLISLTLSAAPPALGSQAAKLKLSINKTDREVVRFNLYRGYLIVAQGTVGPLKGLNFLLDTGATPTVIDPRIARRLHLEGTPSTIPVLGGLAQVTEAVLPGIEFGPVHRVGLRTLVKDLSFLQQALPVRIDAMVGLDALGETPFTIDYASSEILFGPPPQQEITVPLLMVGTFVTVTAEINHAPAQLLLDTGSPSIILFDSSPASSVSALNVSAEKQPHRAIGDFDRHSVQLRSLRFSGTEFGSANAFVARTAHEDGLNVDGLMSPAALGLTSISIDIQKRTMSFSR